MGIFYQSTFILSIDTCFLEISLNELYVYSMPSANIVPKGKQKYVVLTVYWSVSQQT